MGTHHLSFFVFFPIPFLFIIFHIFDAAADVVVLVLAAAGARKVIL